MIGNLTTSLLPWLSKWDIVMQVSYSETFNIIAADAVWCQGVPVVRKPQGAMGVWSIPSEGRQLGRHRDQDDCRSRLDQTMSNHLRS